jgi:hypothetical protein
VAFFDLQNGLKLAIWPRKDIAHEIKVPLGPRSATECTLGHNVAIKAAVNVVMDRTRQAGAVITDPPHDAFWGGYNGSFQDPDGHLWEVVWNPDMEIVRLIGFHKRASHTDLQSETGIRMLCGKPRCRKPNRFPRIPS